MDSWHEVLFKTQLERLVTEREAMKVANEERYIKGQTQAYDENAFQLLVQQFADLEARIRSI